VRGAHFLKFWLPVMVWMSLMFAGSSDLMSAQNTSRIIGPLLRWLNPEVSDETIRGIQFAIRKCAHLTEYAVLALLLWRARKSSLKGTGSFRSSAIFAILVSAAFAATDEAHQHFVASRQASVWDVLLDTGGAMLAMAGLWKAGRWRNKW
jgi:VanZ family protein